MILAACLLAQGCVTANAPLPQTTGEKIILFNGRDLSGWQFCSKGKDVDPRESSHWSVKDGVIDCRGKPAGYMRTEKDHSDYKLHVEWRWTAKPSNSGVLLHMQMPDKVWPKSIESQLRNGNAGDFIVIDGTDFKEHKGREKRVVRKRKDSNEKPAGQWNTKEIFCSGDSIDIYVNGELQNTATKCTVQKGKICLQSEGGPIQFRNVYIEPLK